MELISGAVGPLVATAKGISRFGWKYWRRKKPIRATVETDVSGGWAVAFSSTDGLRDIPGRRISSRDVHDMLMRYGAADYETTRFRLHLENTSKETVDIRNIRIVKTVQAAALSAAYAYYTPAGESRVRYLRYRLDDPAPEAWEMSLDYGSREWRQVEEAPYFSTKRISLQPGETSEFHISAAAKSVYCEWHLVIDFLVAGKIRSFVLDNHGSPFRTSGQPQSGFATDWRWVWWKDADGERGLHLASEI
jgi:hypothetical protein